ncbi:universal stress protein [Maribacter halichondriae]|uniref:universal stress protein n=1 Tax=Maribacter halichondriae TaxID=2980554 RepID=UPI002359BD56|nr:universal stress protein [Maribacter sp. Hal144]
MKKILLPTDFSDNAWNAIVYALHFFKNESCTFYILHTYTPSFYRADYMMGGPTFSAIPDAGVDIAQAGLDQTLADIGKNYKNTKHQFKTLSAFNMLTDEIREVTESKNIDIIIMGTQGATGAKEIFLGTRTVHVIRKSRIPVLVVPNGYVFRELKSVLFPSDYVNSVEKEEVQMLIDMTKMHNAKLTILNVKDDYDLTDGQRENKASLASYYYTLHPKFEQVKGKLMPNAIHEYIEQHGVGLLAMMNRKHSFLDRLIVQPNVDSIGYHTKIPFLVMPYASEESKK